VEDSFSVSEKAPPARGDKQQASSTGTCRLSPSGGHPPHPPTLLVCRGDPCTPYFSLKDFISLFGGRIVAFSARKRQETLRIPQTVRRNFLAAL
jgi:hypothetical protein